MIKKNINKFKEFPPVISLYRIMGPSFIILALGLGSGEVILWPYLVSNYGFGIVWGALVGITFQYFINMEVERYALVKGQSIFVGMFKYFPKAPIWFIISTFLGFGLPGIIAASAQILSYVFNLGNFKWTAMALLVFIGLILSIGRTVYGMMEKVTKGIIFVGVPFLFILTCYLIRSEDIVLLLKGFVGLGHDYWLLPAGISLATFLGAFAYSGAGGNLNLTQSIYVKEKGYGMGKYSQKIASLFSRNSGHQQIKMTGEEFADNPKNYQRFLDWWRKINTEHLSVFWFVGLLAMSLLMLLSYRLTYGLPDNKQGVQFLINEGNAVADQLGLVVGGLFFLVIGVMLFQTQLGVMDSTSRIMSENYSLWRLRNKKEKTINLSRIYFIFVWSQIAFGLLLFSLNFYEPKVLIVLGAVINAIAMFVYLPMIYRVNQKELPPLYRPKIWRQVVMLVIFLFFGFFSAVTLWTKIPEFLAAIKAWF